MRLRPALPSARLDYLSGTLGAGKVIARSGGPETRDSAVPCLRTPTTLPEPLEGFGRTTEVFFDLLAGTTLPSGIIGADWSAWGAWVIGCA